MVVLLPPALIDTSDEAEFLDEDGVGEEVGLELAVVVFVLFPDPLPVPLTDVPLMDTTVTLIEAVPLVPLL